MKFNLVKTVFSVVGALLVAVIAYASYKAGYSAYWWISIKFPLPFLMHFAIGLIAGAVTFLIIAAIVLLPMERFYKSL